MLHEKIDRVYRVKRLACMHAGMCVRALCLFHPRSPSAAREIYDAGQQFCRTHLVLSRMARRWANSVCESLNASYISFHRNLIGPTS